MRIIDKTFLAFICIVIIISMAVELDIVNCTYLDFPYQADSIVCGIKLPW